jgi:hypothetical protein
MNNKNDDTAEKKEPEEQSENIHNKNLCAVLYAPLDFLTM